MSSVPERLLRWLIGLSASLAIATLSLAAASTASASESRAAALLAQVRSGQRSCGGLSPGDFARIGRYDMGQIMGSAGSYQAMANELQASVGRRDAQLAYQFMGERLGGCATGNGPVAFGTMMGLMGTTEMGASSSSRYPGASSGAPMMGGSRSGSSGVSATGVAAIMLGGLVLVALIVWLATRLALRRSAFPRT